MANVYDFLGADDDFFMKSSWNVYTDISGTQQFVGKTGNEKTMSPNLELAEWFDNTSGTQTLFALNIDKFDFSVSFTFMQLLDPNVLSLGWNLDQDLSDANVVRQFMGSSPNALQEAEWRLVGRSTSGLNITLVLRRGICVPNGDFTSGAPGDYTNLPVTIRALQDTSVTNEARDVGYYELDRKAYS